MDGMQMMLKSFGIDTDALKKQMTDVLQGAQLELNKINGKLDAQERQLNRIELMLEALLKDRNLAGVGGGLDSRHCESAGEALDVLHNLT